MKKDKDISAQFPGLFVVHQRIQGQEIGEHEHEDHELFLPLQGEIHIRVGTKKLKAGPGKMIYLPPRTLHSFTADSATQGERLIMIVDRTHWKTHRGGIFGPTMGSVSQLSHEILFHLLIHPKTKAAKALVQTLVQTLSEVLEENGKINGREPAHLEGQARDPRLKAALALIQEKFSEPLAMGEVARAAGLSLRNLNRLFLTELGVSPKQVVTMNRMERAKGLLSEGRLSVTDVSLEVGYTSLSQFIATFRKATGGLPSSFRR